MPLCQEVTPPCARRNRYYTCLDSVRLSARNDLFDRRIIDMAEAEAEQKGGGKKVILFAVVLLVAVGASIGGTWFLMQGSEPVPAEPVEVVQETPTEAIYHNLRPAFVVNYFSGNTPRYLQADLTVVARDPGIIEAVITHTPLIRSRIVTHFADQDFLAIQTHDGKQALRESLRQLIDKVVQEEASLTGVQEVLLTNFVMQ